MSALSYPKRNRLPFSRTPLGVSFINQDTLSKSWYEVKKYNFMSKYRAKEAKPIARPGGPTGGTRLVGDAPNPIRLIFIKLSGKII